MARLVRKDDVLICLCEERLATWQALSKYCETIILLFKLLDYYITVLPSEIASLSTQYSIFCSQKHYYIYVFFCKIPQNKVLRLKVALKKSKITWYNKNVYY